MPQIFANGLEFEYEAFGARAAPLMLLVMGYSAQLIQWEPSFCEKLALRAFRVVRFDNRDAGLSSRLSNDYSLEDMADDLSALIRALGAERAHVVGLAAGGMAAMVLAARRDPALASLCLINSAPDLSEARPTPEVRNLFTAARPNTRAEYIEHMTKVRKALGSPRYWDEAAVRIMAGALFDRAYDPEGMARQMTAIMTVGDLRPRLVQAVCPSLIIHGARDPLTPFIGGVHAHAAIPDADLLILGEMAHDLPPPLRPRLISAIAANARRTL